MKIRKAETADLATLLAFEQEIITAERPFDPTLKESYFHYYDIQALIQAENAEVLVAEINGELAGSGYAQIREAIDYVKYTQFAYLGFMYVKPDYRGKGVIQAILEGLKKWALHRNILEIRLEVYDENLTAKKAYHKAGFAPALLEMRLELKK